MKYAVWQKKIYDGRATERVNLFDDYQLVITVEASGRRDVERLLLTQPDPTSKVGASRRILIGDVLVDQATKEAFIYTPTGAWASVSVVT